MSIETRPLESLERLLARTLRHGTRLATAIIAVGLVVAALQRNLFEPHHIPSGKQPIVSAGLGLFVLLPMVRVCLMLISFVRQRDYRFGAIAALVLAIIFVGLALSLAHVHG